MKVCIFGGNGFLGSRLTARLESEPVNFAVRDVFTEDDECRVDVSSPIAGEYGQFDVFVNLAAVHRDDVRPLSLYAEVNVGGAVNLCDAARKHNVDKIIFTSSVSIYGFAPADTDETGQADYFNDYGRTKFLAESVYRQWQDEDPENRTLVILRPTVIFGEGNRGNVYNLLKQIAAGRFIMFGGGTNRKSMAYVENVAAFLVYSLGFEPGVHIYNYVDKPDLDMNTLISVARKTLFGKNKVGLRLPGFIGVGIGHIADLAARIIGKPLPVSSIRVRKFMSTTQFASSVGKTGFVPPVSLEEGLARTLRYEFLTDNTDKRTFDTE